MPTAQDFQTEPNAIIQSAKSQGLPYVDVNAGDLHRKVGDYSGSDHRMPVCCNVMRQNMQPSDSILNAPPEGDGARLTIRYIL